MNDHDKFKLIMDFLRSHPDMLSGRNSGTNPNTHAGEQYLYAKYTNAINSRLELSAPTTTPDEAVSLILGVNFDYTRDKLECIKIEHQQSMAAENLVGALLERYISSVLEPHGWVWCAGDFVRAVDFIKRTDDAFVLLQVKNRNNTENSSSSAIRNGTDIQKWFRTYSKVTLRRPDNTNWHNFPDPIGASLLSENGFLDFIKNYF